MTKASPNNRGSTKEKERNDWRTPEPLVRAIAKHYHLTFVLDAAASEENTLCPAFITAGMDTLGMSLDRILELHTAGHRRAQEQSVRHVQNPAVWCNPEYNTAAELEAWMNKAAQFSHAFNIPWVFLLPSSRTEQDWFQRSIFWAPQYAFPDGRVAFNYPDGTPGPSPNHPSVVIAIKAPRISPNQVTSIPGDWRKELPKPKRIKTLSTGV